MTTTDIRAVLDERGVRYGSFDTHSEITQNLKRAMHGSTRWDELKDCQREALDMVAHKIGRLLNGDPDYLDSWVDIIGYTQLVVDVLHVEQKKLGKFSELAA